MDYSNRMLTMCLITTYNVFSLTWTVRYLSNLSVETNTEVGGRSFISESGFASVLHPKLINEGQVIKSNYQHHIYTQITQTSARPRVCCGRLQPTRDSSHQAHGTGENWAGEASRERGTERAIWMELHISVWQVTLPPNRWSKQNYLSTASEVRLGEGVDGLVQ